MYNFVSSIEYHKDLHQETANEIFQRIANNNGFNVPPDRVKGLFLY